MNPQKPPAIGTLIAGIGVALVRPRVWLLLVLGSVLFGLAVATPVHQSALDNLAPTTTFADDPLRSDHAMPRWVFDDWTRLHASAFDAASSALAPLLLISSLFGVVVAAGWIHAAIRGRDEHSLKQFLSGAGQYFFPMLRLWLLALVFYALVTWFFWGPIGEWVMTQFFPAGDVDRATSETKAWWGETLRSVLYLFALLKVEILMDLSRAAVVSAGGRSALLALMRGIRFWMWRWPACLLLVGSGFAIEALWIYAAVELTMLASLPLWGLALLVPLGRILTRGGRTSGLALLYHASTLPATPPTGTDAARPGMSAEPLDDGSAWGAST